MNCKLVIFLIVKKTIYMYLVVKDRRNLLNASHCCHLHNGMITRNFTNLWDLTDLGEKNQKGRGEIDIFPFKAPVAVMTIHILFDMPFFIHAFDKREVSQFTTHDLARTSRPRLAPPFPFQWKKFENSFCISCDNVVLCFC